MFILDLKSKPSNLNYNTEEFTINSNQVLSTTRAHNVDSSIQGSSNCPPGIVCNQDIEGGASASQSSVSDLYVDYGLDRLQEVVQRCNTEAGIVVRSESNARFYPAGEVDNSVLLRQFCSGIPVTARVSDDTGEDFYFSEYCDASCGDRNETNTESATMNLNRNTTYVPLTTTATASNTTRETQEKKGLSSGEIAGIVFGSIVGIILINVFIKKIIIIIKKYFNKTKKKL